MKRIKRHKIKKEMPETSASYSREHEEHDLAYYIHDRVELMHQVFSILKYKELKAMAPECVRNLAVGDLQELCTEEVNYLCDMNMINQGIKQTSEETALGNVYVMNTNHSSLQNIFVLTEFECAK